MGDDFTKEEGFRKTLIYYKIYRNISSIILLIARLHTGKQYGRGWKLFYDYEMNNRAEDE